GHRHRPLRSTSAGHDHVDDRPFSLHLAAFSVFPPIETRLCLRTLDLVAVLDATAALVTFGALAAGIALRAILGRENMARALVLTHLGCSNLETHALKLVVMGLAGLVTHLVHVNAP